MTEKEKELKFINSLFTYILSILKPFNSENKCTKTAECVLHLKSNFKFRFSEDYINENGLQIQFQPKLLRSRYFLEKKNQKKASLLFEELREYAQEMIHHSRQNGNVPLVQRDIYSFCALANSFCIQKILTTSRNEIGNNKNNLNDLKLFKNALLALDLALMLGRDLQYSILDHFAQLFIDKFHFNSNSSNEIIKQEYLELKDEMKLCDQINSHKNFLSNQCFCLITEKFNSLEKIKNLMAKNNNNYNNKKQIKSKSLNLPIHYRPSLIEFYNNCYKTNQPAILKDTLVQNQPAFGFAYKNSNCSKNSLLNCGKHLDESQFNSNYLHRVAGFRTVPVEIGSHYLHSNQKTKLMTFDDFLKEYIFCSNFCDTNNNKEIGYLAQHKLFDQIHRFKQDFWVPDYCLVGSFDFLNKEANKIDKQLDLKNSDIVDINCQFGPKGTKSPLHYDPKHNLLVQVVGYKYVRLIDKNFTDFLYAPSKDSDSLMKNTSPVVDIFNPDISKYPKFTEIPQFYEVILEPGDILYIPPKCQHYVESLSISFSVSFQFN